MFFIPDQEPPVGLSPLGAPSSRGGYYVIDDRSTLMWINAQGDILMSKNIGDANMSIIELDDGDIVVGGNGFIDGNSGGTPALIRLSFSDQ